MGACAVSTKIGTTPDRLPELVTAYGLEGSIADAHPVNEIFPEVLVFRVGDLHLIAKPGYQGWDAEHMRFKWGVQQYLHDIGYPIPKMYRTLAGDRMWDPAGEGVVVYDFVGDAYDPSRRQVHCAAAARALGWFHRVGPGAPNVGIHYWEEDAEFEYSRSQVYKSRDWLKAKRLGTEAEARALEVLAELTALFEEVRTRLVRERYWDMPHVPIHGEFYQYHCRYAGDDLLAVIDWDNLRLAPRLHDLSRTIDVGLGYTASVADYSFRWHLTDVPTVADVDDWMAAYLEMAPPFTPREIDLLPDVCAAMWGTAGCPGVPRRDDEVEGCEKVIDFMRFWVREAPAIRDALRERTG